MDMRKWMMMRGGDERREDWPDMPLRGKSSGTLTLNTRDRADRTQKMDKIGFDDREDERPNIRMIRSGARDAHLDEATIREWMDHLQNEDGTTGAHWTMEQVNQIMAQKGVSCDPLEFWATLNMMYSDYLPVAQKANANNADFYVNLAKAFLCDKDAREGKLARYYEAIVK